MRIWTAALAVLTCAPAALGQQSFYCPSPEDVWIVEKEFPEAPAWQYEARIAGHWVAADVVVRRSVPTGRDASGTRNRPSPAVAASRPRAAPMLTHDRAVNVHEPRAYSGEAIDYPPVMPALEWLGVTFDQSTMVCRYTIDDGREHDPPRSYPSEGRIPVNRQSCGPNSRGWRYDSMAGGEVCSESRTSCQFTCVDTPILDSW
ncbi:hypothetical protein [Hyphobacterium sp.]|uniref:hypothetical protein n=1 Tax=Hyphobacterium sp. TaxID=2004662 RepID=UPI003B51EE10